MDEEGNHDFAKGAIQLCAMFGGGHDVNSYGVLCELFCCVQDEFVLIPFLDMVVLRGEQDVGGEL